MSKSVAKVVVEAGLIDENALAQLKRWGFALDLEPGKEPVVSAGEIAKRIIDAVESEEAVELRSTDLDIVKEYLSSRQKAKLHVPNPDDEAKTVGIPVEFSFTKMGEVVIPWTSEAINDMLLDERTYLKPLGKSRIHFSDVRELFYGDHKAFVVCTPTR